MVITLISIVLLSCLSAICGRAGGMGKEPEALPKWIPVTFRQSWARDWLCPLFCVLPLLTQVNLTNWVNIACLFGFYGATGGMLTTYWDWINGKDNFWLSGFMVGIACMFLIPLGVAWYLILIRSIVLAVLWGVNNLICNHYPTKDGVEEFVRYGVLPLTMLILL